MDDLLKAKAALVNDRAISFFYKKKEKVKLETTEAHLTDDLNKLQDETDVLLSITIPNL